MNRQFCISFIVSLILATGLLGASGLARSETLTGTVQDVGAGTAEKGLAGVSVSVRDASNLELATGLTDGNGEYMVTFVARKGVMRVLFEKIGFRPRPVERLFAELKARPKVVRLIREAANDDYYKTASAFLSRLEGAPPEDLQESATVVAALPAGDKGRLLQLLKSVPATNMLAAVVAAEANETVAAIIKDKFRADPKLSNASVGVRAYKGEVELWGYTPDKAAWARAGDIAQSTEGVIRVKNSIVTSGNL